MGTKYKGKKNEIHALDAYIALRRSSNAIGSRLLKHLTEQNLTPGQFGVLEALFHLGPLSQRDVGKKLLSTKGNITLIIDNLEKRDLVKRVAYPEDRRLTTVQLTPPGKALIHKIFPSHVRQVTKIMSTLTLKEMDELKRLCKKVGLSVNKNIT